MDVFEIKVKATVSGAYRVIAKDKHEAKKMAGLMFRNENRHQILATEFDVRPENDQSPVTSHQSPVDCSIFDTPDPMRWKQES